MIKLRVPKRKDLPEIVNQGNFSAELRPGKTIETSSRPFADYLIREIGLTELPGTAANETDQEAAEDDANESDVDDEAAETDESDLEVTE